MSQITIEMQIQCLQRELGYRSRVYPRLVSDGKMTKKKADYEQACMKAALETLQAHHLKHGPTQPSVFDVIQQESADA